MFFDQEGLEYFFLLPYQHEGKTLLSQIHYIIQWKKMVKTFSMTIYKKNKKKSKKKKKDGYLVWNDERKRESSLMQQIFNQDSYGKCIMGGEGYF